jgi:hypothetical protein
LSLLEIITAVRDLTTAIKAQDWPAVLSSLAKLLVVAAELLARPKTMQAVVGEETELESACNELKACTAMRADAGADPKAIDPATIIVIVQLVAAVIEWIKKRRQG